MAVQVRDFISQPEQFEGLYQAANTLEKQRARQEDLAYRQEGRKQASATFLKNYLDPKDFLSGTNYDPQIVKGIQEALTEGAALAAKGASSADIMMALGPKVSRIGEYSTKAKLINQQVKNSVNRLKPYKGYNVEALEQEALKMAFMDDKGQLKDITTVDPTHDWVSETIEANPEGVTTWAGLDDFIKATPMSERSQDITTKTGPGQTIQRKYDTKAQFWMDLEKDDKGEVAVDPVTGKPMGFSVVSDVATGDDGKPMVNPSTGKPYRMLNKEIYSAIAGHNDDIKNRLRGDVREAFKATGNPIPPENSPQWDTMARIVLHDELKTRSSTYFKEVVKPQETAAAVKVEMMQDPETRKILKDMANLGDSGGGSKTQKSNPIRAIGNVFRGDPEYLSGDKVKVDGRDVIDITYVMPGGGLKDGRGEDYTFKSIYFDPAKRELIVEKETPRPGSTRKNLTKEVIPESGVGRFMRIIAESNGVKLDEVKKILEEMGYSGGKFGGAAQAAPASQPAAQKSPSLFDKAKNFFGFGGDSEPAKTETKKQTSKPSKPSKGKLY